MSSDLFEEGVHCGPKSRSQEGKRVSCYLGAVCRTAIIAQKHVLLISKGKSNLSSQQASYRVLVFFRRHLNFSLAVASPEGIHLGSS